MPPFKHIQGRRSAWILSLCTLLSLPPKANSTEPMGSLLTIGSWGGLYEDAQQAAWFSPFSQQTGIRIEVLQHNGGLGQLRNQVTLNNVQWDLVDMKLSDAVAACDSGYLQSLPPELAGRSYPGRPISSDYDRNTLTECAIAHSISATVIAFNTSLLNGQRPTRVRDFFDLDRYPGKRGLQKRPVAILEWALYSYGVPRAQLYQLLSTERGLKLAFDRLERIREQIRWWNDPDEAAHWLATGQVSMSSGSHDRFFAQGIVAGQPVQTLWDGQLYEYHAWAIPKGASQTRAAQALIRYTANTLHMATLGNYLPYGAARRSARTRVNRHYLQGIDMHLHMPTAKANFAKAIKKDTEWYARTNHLIEQRFEQWLNMPAESEPTTAAQN